MPAATNKMHEYAKFVCSWCTSGKGSPEMRGSPSDCLVAPSNVPLMRQGERQIDKRSGNNFNITSQPVHLVALAHMYER